MNEKKSMGKVILIAIAACCVIVAFILFIRDNSKRATTISVNSLEDATVQSAQRIDEIMERAGKEILLTASLYESMSDTPEVTAEDLQVLTEKSLFDYIEFAGKDGMKIDSQGDTIDVTDRHYYQDGMKGNSGMDAVFGSKLTGENLVVFYTPLYWDEEIIGVLIGLYRQDQMKDILYSTFFGEEARTYLCTSDGSVIASYNSEGVAVESVFDEGAFHTALNGDVEADLKNALSTGEDYQFQYQGSKGNGNAYVTQLDYSGWELIQTFPSQVTSAFISDANMAGVQLLLELVCIFVICLITVQVAASVQRKRLEQENTEMSHVVDGITQLFGSFVLVDFENDSYKYLAETKPRFADFPLQGDYDSLKNLIVSLLKDDEEQQRLEEQLEKNTLLTQLDENTPHLRFEYEVNSDRDQWDSINIICLNRVDGMPKEVLFTYQDVTTVKLRELESYKALKEAYQAVEAANQAKSAFLSNMSHDIRTPMNAIMGMTAIAAMNIQNPDRVKDCLNKITISSQHLLGLINEVLDMSKIESGKLIFSEEEFNLSEVLDGVITMFLPQTEAKKQNFKVNIADVSHEEVIGDNMRLQQVFVNILGNAVKFTPEGGNITLSIQEKNSNMHGHGCYVFTFEDDGIGMEESFIDKIFEPFARAQDSRTGNVEGTGLGMPIVKNIVHLMNGDIQVKSRLNEGTTFTVTIYLKLNHFQQENVRGLENLAVLVADDDRFACESACGILDEIGMKADWVLSGDEAVEKLWVAHSDNKDYAAVILDWKMPGKDGLTTAKEIRAKIGEEVPIIILSAFDYSAIEQEARAAGVNAFISKPLFKSRLVYVMKSLMLGEEESNTEIDQLQDRDYSGKRVLLVEDNELNMEIAEELLRQTGVEVDCAENGRVAVERVTQMPENYYDLIFMDIQMPEMNGYEATKSIRGSWREDMKTVPIVAMTADAFTDDVKHAKDVGMNGHIAKPVEIEKLLKVMDKWI